MDKNHGILINTPKVTDYILGVNSPISVARLVKDWSSYLPDNETQRNSIVDFLDCVSMSMIHSIEMQCNYLHVSNQIPDEFLNFLNDNGYIQNNKIKFSVRYNAKMNGTDITKGQYQNVAGDHVRKDGLLPDRLLTMSNSMTWGEFYSVITQSNIDIAKKILWFLNIQYQFLNVSDIPHSLLSAPIQVATEVCAGWDSGNLVLKCSGQPLQHATVIYGQTSDLEWLDLDHYPPFQQKLSHDYELPSNVQYIVSMKPTALRNGMRGSNVLLLQQNLNKIGYKLIEDGKFGPKTAQAVIDFQNKNNLSKDGIAGPLTITQLQIALSATHVSKIDVFCNSIAKYEGANPQLNNPGDLEWHSQKFAVKDGRWAKFDTYEHGYEALKDLITRACEGKIIAYNEDGTIYDFFCVYAPSSDSNNPQKYADWVGLQLGVDAEKFIIKDLL